jgi:hypothetical protein
MDAALAEEINGEVDTDLHKLIDSYKVLLKKCVVNKSLGIHEQFEVEASATNIVYHCQHLLDIVYQLKTMLILQQQRKTAADQPAL